MREIPFGSFQELNKNSNNRKIVLFGAGSGAHKTGRKLNQDYSFMVDNNPNLANTIEDGKDVFEPEILKENQTKYYVIICTTSFTDVSAQLQGYGYTPQKDYIVSPILNDLRVISELENHSARMLFTSGLPEVDDPQSGGGVYELILEGHNWSYKKIYSGICYGLIKHDGTFITVDDKKGVIQFDKDYNILSSKELNQATRGHGIAYSENKNQFYIVSSYRDSIIILDAEFSEIDEISISNKYKIEGEPLHHCNDLCIVGNSLYVTMFSYTGNWKRDIFDGVALEIDLTTNLVKNPVITDLWMPHNISYLNGSLVVLDSLRGELKA
ncbi:MAG: hypothetical protein U9Q77_00835, partial [Candidatus Marinimicrobia bacterium]|nr:hypothetical protein [Candidatus Neomarinimicrobiota bacterium]